MIPDLFGTGRHVPLPELRSHEPGRTHLPLGITRRRFVDDPAPSLAVRGSLLLSPLYKKEATRRRGLCRGEGTRGNPQGVTHRGEPCSVVDQNGRDVSSRCQVLRSPGSGSRRSGRLPPEGRAVHLSQPAVRRRRDVVPKGVGVDRRRFEGTIPRLLHTFRTADWQDLLEVDVPAGGEVSETVP